MKNMNKTNKTSTTSTTNKSKPRRDLAALKRDRDMRAKQDRAPLGRLFLGKSMRTFCFDVDIPGDLGLLLGAMAWSIEAGDQNEHATRPNVVTCRMTLREDGLDFTDLLWLMRHLCTSVLPLCTLAYEGMYTGEPKDAPESHLAFDIEKHVPSAEVLEKCMNGLESYLDSLEAQRARVDHAAAMVQCGLDVHEARAAHRD